MTNMEDIFSNLTQELDKLTIRKSNAKPYTIPQPSAPRVVPLAEVVHIRTLPSN
jgi:hypothetical protein